MIGVILLSDSENNRDLVLQVEECSSVVSSHAGTRAFSVAVPILWNSLSEHVRSSNNRVPFRHHLKLTFFRLAYPS